MFVIVEYVYLPGMYSVAFNFSKLLSAMKMGIHAMKLLKYCLTINQLRVFLLILNLNINSIKNIVAHSLKQIQIYYSQEGNI